MWSGSDKVPPGSFQAERARYIRAKKYAARHRISIAQAYGKVRWWWTNDVRQSYAFGDLVLGENIMVEKKREVTQEMIWAGADALWDYDEESTNITPDDAVRRIYLRMEECRIQSSENSQGLDGRK